jgi:hypothetical protein
VAAIVGVIGDELTIDHDLLIHYVRSRSPGDQFGCSAMTSSSVPL